MMATLALPFRLSDCLLNVDAGANAGADNTSAAVQAAFRGYDSCSVPLLLLVETLVEAAGSPAAFCTALLSSLPSWLDVVSV